jgi:hypothetical protein
MAQHKNNVFVGLFREADGRVRTGDIRFTKPVLYQLSYVGAASHRIAAGDRDGLDRVGNGSGRVRRRPAVSAGGTLAAKSGACAAIRSEGRASVPSKRPPERRLCPGCSAGRAGQRPRRLCLRLLMRARPARTSRMSGKIGSCQSGTARPRRPCPRCPRRPRRRGRSWVTASRSARVRADSAPSMRRSSSPEPMRPLA